MIDESLIKQVSEDPLFAAFYPKDGLGGLFSVLSDDRLYHVYFIGTRLHIEPVR